MQVVIQIKLQRLCVNANKGTYHFYKEQINTPDFYFNNQPICDQVKRTCIIKLVEQRQCAMFLLCLEELQRLNVHNKMCTQGHCSSGFRAGSLFLTPFTFSRVWSLFVSPTETEKTK